MISLRNLMFLILLLIASSCTTTSGITTATWEPKPITHPWLIGAEVCRPPCWNGIIPGETTFEEALDIVLDLEFFSEEGSIKTQDDKSSLYWYGGDRNNAYIDFYENKVIFIQLLIEIYDLGSVVNHFGEPDGYTVDFDEGFYAIKVFYPNIGLVFVSYQDWGDPISQDMPGDSFYFLSPEDPKNFSSVFYKYLNISYSGFPEKQYIKWEGFGIIPENED